MMTQTWKDLLFVHYRFPPDEVRRLIPEPLQLDTFDGHAFVGIVPFKMTAVRLRSTPELPYFSSFLELNVRTYVSANGVSGVYFFSLDASNPLAVEGARLTFHLPYYLASMSVKEIEGWFTYKSIRIDKRGGAAALDLKYSPQGEPFRSKAGSLEYFLTERYCLFTTRGEEVLCAHVHHEPWPLQRASAIISTNTMLDPLTLKSIGEPHLLFSKSLCTLEWAPDLVNRPVH